MKLVMAGTRNVKNDLNSANIDYFHSFLPLYSIEFD